MRNNQKREVILDFLKEMSDKDIHLVEVGRFDKEMSIWNKRKPQSSHRTLINVKVRLYRLNEKDCDGDVDKFLLKRDW